MSPNSNIVLQHALAAYDAGLNPCPPKMDGSKAPVGIDAEGHWKELTERRVTQDEIYRWWGQHTGLGVFCGAISGNLEVIDFDDAAVYEAFRGLASDSGLGDLVDHIEAGFLEQSGGGAYHWAYYCEEIEGNQKLAKRPIPGNFREYDTLIETRGEGGYIITAPSSGRVHPTGNPYVLLRGGFSTISTITPAERRSLFEIARIFDLTPKVQIPEPRGSAPAEGTSGTRPGDQFNASVTWRDVLEPHGWRFLFERGSVGYWRRPGKDMSISATTNYENSDLLYVFSTSTVFESERGYSKFSAYALLDHAGDFAAAARALGQQGFGSWHSTAQPNAEGENQVFIRGWTWDETRLYRVKLDGTQVAALNREVRPAGIIKAGDTNYLELIVNKTPLTLSNAWVGVAKNAATRALAAAGLAFTDKQAVVLQEFVSDALSVGANLPVKEGAETLGWHGDQLVLGHTEDTLHFVPKDETQHVHGFGRCVGNEVDAKLGWTEVMELAPTSVWVGVGAACGSPLLSCLPDQYHVFIVHYIGPKSTGKTTIQRVSAAIYGDPHLLVSSWDTTHVGLERLLATCRHLPCFLDETGANIRQDNLGPLVMMVAGGIGRTRGSVDGMRITPRWRNVVLSTGETSPTQGSVAGVYRRILMVHSALDSVPQVDRLDDLSEEAHGWPAFWLRDVLLDRDRWAAEILAATAHYESLLADYPGAYRSQSKCWAVVDAGARAMAEALGLDTQLAIDAIESIARNSAERQSDQLDPADRLLWAVVDDLASMPKAYQPEALDFKAAFRGRRIDSETVAVLRTPLMEMSRRMGVPDLDAALSVLKDRDCLVTDPGRLNKQVRIGGTKNRCHVFRIGDFVGGDEDAY